MSKPHHLTTTNNNSSSIIQITSLVKKASQLSGLKFGNRIDDLVQSGIAQKTFTFLYGNNVSESMNTLCLHAVQVFGGQSLFIDGANSFDPYLLVKKSKKKNESSSRTLLKSIIVVRAFTCYQLNDIIAKLGKTIKTTRGGDKNDNDADGLGGEGKRREMIKSIFVTGVGDLFEEGGSNPKSEVAHFESLMSISLRDIMSDKQNGVLFVVASSRHYSKPFGQRSDISIEISKDKETKKQKAFLMKHPSFSRKKKQQQVEIEF